jgi:AGCS family alanine or glycine:cation symporter
MGMAAIAHASSTVEHPADQGMMGIIEVFLDTIIICTVTALVILTSGTTICYGTDEGASLTTRAFACTYGRWVSIPMALFLCCFAFATMLGWGLYGIRCAQYLFGDGAWKPFVLMQAVISTISVLLKTGTVWMLAEIVNGLMAIPNLICLAVLSPQLILLIDDYQKKKSANRRSSKS